MITKIRGNLLFSLIFQYFNFQIPISFFQINPNKRKRK